MRIGLFVPCYIDAFFPEVGIATLELLERLGHEVVYPARPDLLRPADGKQRLQRRLRSHRSAVRTQFLGHSTISCAFGQLCSPCARQFRCDRADRRCEGRSARGPTNWSNSCTTFQKVDAFPWARFPHRVGLHNSCGTLRRLRHAAPSELHEPFFSKPMDLLSKVEGIEFVMPARPDECCGFGGTFSVFEEVVSTKMGYDKVIDHAPGRCRVHRLRRQLLPDAPAGLRRADRRPAEIHPHRADPEWSQRMSNDPILHPELLAHDDHRCHLPRWPTSRSR